MKCVKSFLDKYPRIKKSIGIMLGCLFVITIAVSTILIFTVIAKMGLLEPILLSIFAIIVLIILGILIFALIDKIIEAIFKISIFDELEKTKIWQYFTSE